MLTEITINRQKGAADWTLSTFTANDNSFKGVGVEDEFRKTKVHGETRIPAYRYELSLTYSPKFSKEYFRDDEGNLILAKDRTTTELKTRYHTEHEAITVNNVVNFSRVLWHWGNTDDDTDACYIVGSVFGKTKGQDGVLNSRKKYTEIYPIIWRALKAGKVFANYVDHE